MTIVDESASIGANATIIIGITISKFAMIGGGRVVAENAPPLFPWFVNPALHKGYVTKLGEMSSINLLDKKKK